MRFVGQDVAVLTNEDANGIPQVAHAWAEAPFQNITFAPDTPEQYVRGLEPSLTADGQLLLYHGNGNDYPNVNNGSANITYLYNETPCSASGWTAPRTITQLPDFTDTPGGPSAVEKAQAFKQKYRLFAQPIRMPPSAADPDGHIFADGIDETADTVCGAYPWVSKDGSFFMAQGSGSDEALQSNPNPRFHVRTGAYVCGDITGGYIKHIDDVGVNPTRWGGPWDWPLTNNNTIDSWRTFLFTTGLKPGLWEPLLGSGAPFPSMPANARVPVMPVLCPETDTYGEVRFEEADGDYYLYLSCNESLLVDPSGQPGEKNVLYDLSSTPDTSGRATRARCTLNAGAKFPQEVVGSSAELRAAIGAAIGADHGITGSLHECVGFKGQAIVLNGTGNIDARNAPGLAGLSSFTAQAFVKLVGTPGSTMTLLEYGGVSGSTFTPAFTLKYETSGMLTAKVWCGSGAVQAESRPQALPAPVSNGLFDPEIGWRHVAVVFDNTSSYTRLRIFLDGQQELTAGLKLGNSVVKTQPGAPYYLVGPGRGAADAVDESDMLFVLDEVGFSDLTRTAGELRRDAYVVPADPSYEEWPGPTLPLGLDPAEALWPIGVPYDADIVALGQTLFDDTVLSSVGRKCTTCHVPAQGFAHQGVARDLDVNSSPLEFNTPTVLNATFGVLKRFDGSAASIETQVWQPILSGLEMGTQTVTEVLDRINTSHLADDFTSTTTFGEPADKDNVAQALAMYIRSLNVGNSAYDNQVHLETNGGYVPGLPVMTDAQKRGRALFFGKARCFGCHRGSAFTDNDFHNVLTVAATSPNAIRGDATGRPADDGRVKTPTLRNVEHTKPYFHDGSKAELIDVVLHYDDPPFGPSAMGTADLDLRPLGLSAAERSDLVEFLKSLSGTP